MTFPDRTLLDEARAIRHGRTMKSGTTEHVCACVDLLELYERTMAMLLLEQNRDHMERIAHTDALETRLSGASWRAANMKATD